MENFAEQCLDLARSTLGNNIDAINEDGSISPIDGESSRIDEAGHAALAIGEFYRATQETKLEDKDIIDLAARCITAQAFEEEGGENGLAYTALGLLSFGPSKDRNIVWERLLEPTQEMLDKRLLARSDYNNHFQAFNIAKAVCRFSMSLSKKDETGKLIDKFVDRIKEGSSTGYCDDAPDAGIGGCFDIYGIMSFVNIRQALQLHSNIHLRDRKLPSLRTYGEKYLKMLPDVVRSDGLAWCYGRGIGAYGQMHCISLVLQSIRDGWIDEKKLPNYLDLLRRMFFYFFGTYMDQENGTVVIRDNERDTFSNHTTRMANFDAARYLCQWSRLAKSIGSDLGGITVTPPKTSGRFVVFDKTHKKEQGVFIYKNKESGLHVQVPLISSGHERTSDSLAFPHCPGVFDWPINRYLPIMLPELTFGEHVIIPAFYGKRCTAGLGSKNALYFRYEQPELITKEEKFVNHLGSCKVNWTFSGNKINSEFVFMVKNQVQMERMRYVLALGSPHSTHRIGNSFKLGAGSHRTNIIKDDFQAQWQELQTVSDDSSYKTYTGKIHYLQILSRDHPLIMHPGKQYRLQVEFDPDLTLIDE